MKTAVVAFDQVAKAENSLCITEAAKALQTTPQRLFWFMQEQGWIYKRAGGSSWLGYQAKVQGGLLEQKVTTVCRSDGSEKIVEQVRVTAKGLTQLTGLISTH